MLKCRRADPGPPLHRDWAALTPATSAPGLGSPRPHLHRDWARPGHICTEAGLTPATSAPGLGRKRLALAFRGRCTNERGAFARTRLASCRRDAQRLDGLLHRRTPRTCCVRLFPRRAVHIALHAAAARGAVCVHCMARCCTRRCCCYMPHGRRNVEMQLMGLPMQFRAPYMPWVRRVPESTLVLPHCTLEYRRVPYLTHPCGILDYHTVPYSTGVPACLGALRRLFPDGRKPGRGPARHRRWYRSALPCLALPTYPSLLLPAHPGTPAARTGHIYYFFDDVYPHHPSARKRRPLATPEIMYRLFGGERRRP